MNRETKSKKSELNHLWSKIYFVYCFGQREFRHTKDLTRRALDGYSPVISLGTF